MLPLCTIHFKKGFGKIFYYSFKLIQYSQNCVNKYGIKYMVQHGMMVVLPATFNAYSVNKWTYLGVKLKI